jgi:DNA-binding CsgD family transcriptional regulator
MGMLGQMMGRFGRLGEAGITRMAPQAAGAAAGGLERLTPMERSVVEMLQKGAAPEQVAQELGIDPSVLAQFVAKAKAKMTMGGVNPGAFPGNPQTGY